MWWFDRHAKIFRLGRIALALAAAGLVAGCFQPLYGERSVTSTPGTGGKLSMIDVMTIAVANGRPEDRLGVDIRNALLFGMNNAGPGSNPAYRLKISLSTSRQQVIVDIYTSRPDIENYGIDASYSLIDNATNKVVLTGQTFARVSYDIPG